MIARIWTGVTAADKADAYLDYLHQTGLADYSAIPGHRGTTVLRRIQDGRATFTILTRWDSMAAIRAFAGDDPERARYYPEDDAYLLERRELVEHYEIVYDEAGNQEDRP